MQSASATSKTRQYEDDDFREVMVMLGGNEEISMTDTTDDDEIASRQVTDASNNLILVG